uniref:Secreted protein n=1 Tax=Arion vulgaris TaxID=1028688 RepID=A0A0B7AUV0_9EUPU
MNYYVRLVLTVFLTVLGSARCDLDFCEDGFQISKKYTNCWTQSTFEHKYKDLHVQHEVYTAKFVEDYAKHMCSVVKPNAIACLRKEISECSNIEKILEMADDSGGTCNHNKLNPFFKLHIIDHLAPVKSNSPCLTIADNSDCYDTAIKGVKQKGIHISRFHYEADKFFASIWDCQVRLFKSQSDICKHWQLPMLLSLQAMAMPSLFGMKLTNVHVALLELSEIPPSPVATSRPELKNNVNRNKLFVLLKVLRQKPEIADEGILLQVNLAADQDDHKNNVKIVNLTDKKNKQNKSPKVTKVKTGKHEDENEMIN